VDERDRRLLARVLSLTLLAGVLGLLAASSAGAVPVVHIERGGSWRAYTNGNEINDLLMGACPAMPVFAVLQLMWEEGMEDLPRRVTGRLESGGGVVLHPDEFLASLNPEFMIEWATPILGAGHPALAQAQDLLAQGDFLDSLSTVREALRTLPGRSYRLDSEDITIRANAWVTDLALDRSGRRVSFQTRGPPEGTVRAAVEIPKERMGRPSVVRVDGQSHTFATSESGTHTTLELQFAQGPHAVEGTGAADLGVLRR